jgi:acyl-CoA thioesterase FadM
MLRYLTSAVPVILRAQLRADGATTVRTRHRVRLGQIDLNLHLNQAEYAREGEWGRATWVLRSRAWSRWRAAGVNPVVASQHIVYRRELKPLQRFLIDTRSRGMDGRLLHLEQHLLVGDRVHARIETRLIFVGPAGVLSAEDTAALCEGLHSAPLAIDGWRAV